MKRYTLRNDGYLIESYRGDLVQYSEASRLEDVLNSIRELASHLGKESEFLCGKDDRPEDYRIGRVYHEIQTQILKLLDQ